jgi:hypothetical protein
MKKQDAWEGFAEKKHPSLGVREENVELAIISQAGENGRWR